MMAKEDPQQPSNEKGVTSSPERQPSAYRPFRRFHIDNVEQEHYKQQYSDIYFLRLAKLKPAAEQAGEEAWNGFEVGGSKVQKKDRVLEVRQGELCWIVGTVYMEMPLKPNILEDITRDHWVSAPSKKLKYIDPSGRDEAMLEDESGRLRLVGSLLKDSMLVTGSIIAIMGTENSDGAFEVIDYKVPDLPRQPQRWEQDDCEAALVAEANKKRKISTGVERTEGGKIALVSGLAISGDKADSLALDLLMEYILGELGGEESRSEVSCISRLLIVGNSIGKASTKDDKKTGRKYGYDASAYNPAPTAYFDNFLSSLLPSIPITLIPGATDPANTSLPQQPLHMAMLPQSRAYATLPQSKEIGWLDTTTNPWEGDIDGWRFLGNSGQPIDDVFRYVKGNDRLQIMENLLRWRNGAPTAPDTLPCHPYRDDEPFVIEDCPHIYIVGNQPKFATSIIDGPAGQDVRLLALPKFKETGELLLLSSDTLDIEIVKFDIHNA